MKSRKVACLSTKKIFRCFNDYINEITFFPSIFKSIALLECLTYEHGHISVKRKLNRSRGEFLKNFSILRAKSGFFTS